MKKGITSRLIAIVVACGVAASIGVAGASADAPPTAQNTNVAPWEQGAPATGSITIHKKDSVTTSKGLQGAKFKITRVKSIDGITADLTKRDTWLKIAEKVTNLNAGTETGVVFGNGNDITTVTTNQQGEAPANGLFVGLYKIEETQPPAGYSSDVKPFFMTIPEVTGNKNGNAAVTWNYHVSVTPKNTEQASKLRKDQDLTATVGANDNITYTITAPVNATDAAKLKGYAVFDDALKSAYQAIDQSVVTEVKVGANTVLVKNNDYEITTEDNPNSDNTRTRLLVKMKDAGLKKLATAAKADSNVKVSVKLVFKLKSSGLSTVENKYGFIPGHGDGTPTPNPITPPNNMNPTVKFMKFEIKKVSAKDNTGLQGGMFKLFAKKTDAEACAKNTSATECSNASQYGEKTTNGDGLTSAYLAKMNDKFWAVETVAPTGYLRNDQAIEVNITDKNKGTDTYMVTVKNVPTKDSGFWFTLPQTGAAGVVLFAMIGLGLVSVGVFLHVRSRARQQ